MGACPRHCTAFPWTPTARSRSRASTALWRYDADLFFAFLLTISPPSYSGCLSTFHPHIVPYRLTPCMTIKLFDLLCMYFHLPVWSTQAYAASMKKLFFSGPTLFAPLINQSIAVAAGANCRCAALNYIFLIAKLMCVVFVCVVRCVWRPFFYNNCMPFSCSCSCTCSISFITVTQTREAEVHGAAYHHRRHYQRHGGHQGMIMISLYCLSEIRLRIFYPVPAKSINSFRSRSFASVIHSIANNFTFSLFLIDVGCDCCGIISAHQHHHHWRGLGWLLWYERSCQPFYSCFTFFVLRPLLLVVLDANLSLAKNKHAIYRSKFGIISFWFIIFLFLYLCT